MNPALLDQIVNAVLYEGYILYPYRPSSSKNRNQRFTFGRVYPEAYSVAQEGKEPFVMQTECLVKAATKQPALRVSVGFLHLMARESADAARLSPAATATQLRERGKVLAPTPSGSAAAEDSRTPSRPEAETWYEAVERKVAVPALALKQGLLSGATMPFCFSGSRTLEGVSQAQQSSAGVVSRTQETVEGTVEVMARGLRRGWFRVTVRISNCTPWAEPQSSNDQEVVLMRTLASTHAILGLENGEFVSLLDPPAEIKSEAAECRNIGTWPVLVGDEQKGERNAMLSSPIILYDYPKLAPESAGLLFDSTEIDELLSLRILTLTDEEKQEMRHVEQQARRLLERTEALPQEAWLKMHGTMRKPEERKATEFDDFFGAGTRLTGVRVGSVFLKAGDKVRLRPRARADIIDMALSGKTAIVEAVEQDMERRVHLAVVVEGDPGKDLGLQRQPGHRFFFGVDEVEPLEAAA